MTKYLITFLLTINSIWAIDVPIDEVEKQIFQEEIKVNSKIIQLSSSKSLVMAELGGKIVKYLVKKGDRVKKGKALALISLTSTREISLQIEPLRVELKELQNRLSLSNNNYEMVKKLYLIGVESQQNMNIQEEERAKIISDIEVVKAKLSSLDIGQNASENYTIYAQSSGRVDDILVSPNAIVDANRALISIVKGEESFLVQSYIPLKYASQLKVGQKGKLLYGGKEYEMYISQILPKVDEKTQQIVIHSTLSKTVKNLFVNTYIDSKLSIGQPKEYLAVKKSALSFFNNEWVVFVPKHHDENEEEKHDEEEEAPYEIRVVKIIKQNNKFVAIKGLKEHEDYVSAKSYYVKSLLLKSSLGDGD